ncbi:MAG: DMT family transporter [Burkholderiales bacterium]
MSAVPNRAREFALLGLLALLWGSSYLLIRVALETLPPLTLIAVRVSVAALVLLAALAALRLRLPRGTAAWRALLAQAMLNSILPWTLLAWGQQTVASGLAGVLNSTSPLFVFLLMRFVTRHEAAGPLQLAGAVLGVAGVALIVGAHALEGLGQAAAQLAILAAALLYAFAAIYGRRHADTPPIVTAAGTLLWASVWLVPASLLVDRPWTLSPSLASIGAALALAVFGTALALMLYFRLVRTLGSMGVASQSYLRAGVSVLLGAVILGERVDATTGAGLAAVVAGVAALNSRRPA